MAGTSNKSLVGNIVVTQYEAPVAGATVNANAGTEVLFLNPAGTLATLTVVLPVTPVEGQDFTLATSQIITTLTITGAIVGTLTTLALGGFARFVYSAAAAKWFRCG